MHILDANEIFGVTAYTYDRIMEAGGKYGADAFAVYFKLLEQTRIQQTNQTFTLDVFLEKFFGWGNKRLSIAKGILKDLGLIDNVVVRDELGRMKAHYVRVNYLINENKVRNACSTYSLSTGVEIQGVDSTTGGEMETNALSTKLVNTGSTKQKESASDFSSSTSTSDDVVVPYHAPTRIIFSTDDLRDFAPYIDDFRNYWEEPTSKGVPKWRLEKTWDTHRRLITWKKNDDTNFGRNKPVFPLEDVKTASVQYYLLRNFPDKQKKYADFLAKHHVLDKWKDYASMVLGSGFKF